MQKSSIEIIKRMITYAICILIIHLGCNLIIQNIFSIDIMQEIKDNILLSIPLSFLLIYCIFIKGIKKEKNTTILFAIEVFILTMTIDLKFMIFSEAFLIFLRNKEKKQEDIINRNIKEYFKSKEKEN